MALAAAHRWQADRPDGSAWVDLSALHDPTQVVTAVAQGLGLALSPERASATLVEALRPMHVLIVLDNAEQVLSAVAELAAAHPGRCARRAPAGDQPGAAEGGG